MKSENMEKKKNVDIPCPPQQGMHNLTVYSGIGKDKEDCDAPD